MDQDPNHNKTRTFVCSCGKDYLSYAALFTHIKQKHDGKAPGPIVRPRSQRKRGRPRKNQALNDPSSNSQQVGQNLITNIKQINNKSRIELDLKRKKAAELLGCGSFKGFTAYNPDFGGLNQLYQTLPAKNQQYFKQKLVNQQPGSHQIQKATKNSTQNQQQQQQQIQAYLKLTDKQNPQVDQDQSYHLMDELGKKQAKNFSSNQQQQIQAYLKLRDKQNPQVDEDQSYNLSQEQFSSKSEDIQFEQIHEALNMVQQARQGKGREENERDQVEGDDGVGFQGNQARVEDEIQKNGVPQNPLQLALTQI